MRLYLILILFFIVHRNYAQQNYIDSLKHIINQIKKDQPEANALIYLSYTTENFDTAVAYARQGLLLSQKLNFKKGEANSNLMLSSLFGRIASTAQSIQHGLNALDIFQQLNDNVGIASAHLMLQGGYRDALDFPKALYHEIEGERVARKYDVIGNLIFNGHRLAPLFLAETAQTYILINYPDSAFIYAARSIKENELFDGTSWTFPYYLLATVQQIKGDYGHSLINYHKALQLAKAQSENEHDTIQIYSGMSTLFRNSGQLDSSIYYAEIVNKSWQPEVSEPKNLLEALNNLYLVYTLKGEKDSTLKYLELKYRLDESFFNTEKEKQIQEITFNSQLKQQEIIAEQIKYNSRLQGFLFTAGILTLLIISGLLIRNNRQNKKAKLQIEKAYNVLKSTQAQLIQSEKMAYLGELTAGIAHEIQNPLNFVNNFSEVNNELIEELQGERSKVNGERNEEIEDEILNDVKQNLERIIHHGKRADAIVKGMLQHSRTSTGQKELTDINALCDEYLRLSYHGMRAKDKSFNAEIKTDFDKSIGKINIIPQDIGRVFLNLFNNAFYAVNERQKSPLKGREAYEPKVTVTTKRVSSNVFGAHSSPSGDRDISPLGAEGLEVRVKDNGLGIPQKVVDKIFQPFFTTKPTGQGTGLGLSLSYDIIKAHGGEIRVESKEGEGSELVIQLPVV